MELYILRHAIAVPRGTPGYPDDNRPLTDEGIRKMRKAARGLKRILPELDAILTSPMERAAETAHIVAEALHLEDRLFITESLKPGMNEKRVFAELAHYEHARALMLVGHEPDLSTLASTLIGAPAAGLELKKGCAMRIDVDALPPHDTGRLVFLLQPKHLRALGSP